MDVFSPSIHILRWKSCCNLDELIGEDETSWRGKGRRWGKRLVYDVPMDVSNRVNPLSLRTANENGFESLLTLTERRSLVDSVLRGKSTSSDASNLQSSTCTLPFVLLFKPLLIIFNSHIDDTISDVVEREFEWWKVWSPRTLRPSKRLRCTLFRNFCPSFLETKQTQRGDKRDWPETSMKRWIWSWERRKGCKQGRRDQNGLIRNYWDDKMNNATTYVTSNKIRVINWSYSVRITTV